MAQLNSSLIHGVILGNWFLLPHPPLKSTDAHILESLELNILARLQVGSDGMMSCQHCDVRQVTVSLSVSFFFLVSPL